MKVLRSRTESSGRVNATVVEPVPDMVSLFKARIAADETSHQQDMSYAWKTQTLDEFRGEIAGKDEVKFHFISSVHSIYYVPDLEATMKDLYDRLEPGGVMMVIVVSGKALDWYIQPVFTGNCFSEPVISLDII